jgi:formylglycine-generating enzyme required for sulfatase activity
MARIFLCHASEDKAAVRDVYRRLRDIEGIEPWLDEEDLLPGQDWAREIPRALKASEFILIFLSLNSVAKRGYVQREMKLALDALQEMPEGTIHTIPVRLDDCTVPEQLQRYHYANLFDPRGFERLVRAIRAGLSQRQQPGPAVRLEESTEPARGVITPAPPQDAHAGMAGWLATPAWLISASEDRINQLMRHVWLKSDLSQSQGVASRLTNSIGMEFVLIPAGTFMMGSPDSYAAARDSEKPAHRVTISRPFYLGKYAVTQEQWKAVMGTSPSRFTGDGNRPVECVSWDHAQEFIRRLNAKEGGMVYRLPTEAEWEYACRAGSQTAYSFGDDVGQLGGYAWYAENSGDTTHPVGQKQPNAWGLYDMHGNVCQWVQDWYGEYAPESVTDPQGPASGLHRVMRGGSWNFVAGFCPSACRLLAVPGARDVELGFRLVREAR